MRKKQTSLSNKNAIKKQAHLTDNLYDQLVLRKEVLTNLIKEKQQAIIDKPTGSIRINRNKNGRVQYYLRKTGSEKCGTYLRNGNDNLIKTLLQKEYDQKVLATAQEELKFLDKLIKHTSSNNLASIYDSMAPERQQWISPVFLSDQEYAEEWNKFEYTGLTLDDNDSVRLTRKGEKVRSKSEMLIANMLYEYQIPYRYECPLQDENVIFAYPDFTVLNVKERKVYYWEHLGMMDDPGYIQRTLKKFAKYTSKGIIQGKNLLLTYESSTFPINMNEVEQIIRTFLI